MKLIGQRGRQRHQQQRQCPHRARRADKPGHFTHQIRINDQLIDAVVDTGASTIAIGKRDADRLRIDYSARPPNVGTANGTAKAWSVCSHNVRMGEVQV